MNPDFQVTALSQTLQSRADNSQQQLLIALDLGADDPPGNGNRQIDDQAFGLAQQLGAFLFERLVQQVETFDRFPRFSLAFVEAGLAPLLITLQGGLFQGLLVDFARAQEALVLVRGLRAYSDFEYEFQMALTNRKLAPEIETLFMMPKEIHSYVSSSTVREVSRLGGDTSQFVPECVQQHIDRKFGR